ncbi:hypothetical protein MAC_08315 [Metarhizium acridum CQMa 102]|uniref:NADAR domain-containing protein n=1 Tax=Metarhizium acridum (strain CQMa 102) TaxID=655827 RepID=E9EEL7_METAQ|nr:uncharacterized protein MAC_08315 [Metarhizium acridum CQMa 102]EFY85668.1 hypothetical protein MAC_08315 [Metarhizium acridum CQMa 102]
MTESSNTTDNPVYFWRDADTETGWLSQWYYCPFTDDKNPEIVYDTAKQSVSPARTLHPMQRCANYFSSYMMYHKALLFNDQAVADQVLSAGHPRDAKALGRQVQNSSDETWKKHRTAIVQQGNLLKFTGAVTEKGFRKGTGNDTPPIDGSLREMLLATGTREIVEASPYDKTWGIGCLAADAERRRAYWGLNLLGKALMEVRWLLREQTPQT